MLSEGDHLWNISDSICKLSGCVLPIYLQMSWASLGWGLQLWRSERASWDTIM